MTKINVTQPFSLRLGSGKGLHEYGVGVHEISDEEFGHWFFKACLESGRATILSEPEPKPDPVAGKGGGEAVAPTKDELLALKADELKALCEACGIAIPVGNPAKAALADLLLAGHEGVTLLKGPYGIYTQKAE